MALDRFMHIYIAMGMVIWLVVVLREYYRMTASEIALTLVLTVILWPVMIIAALLRLFVFRHYDQDD